MGVEGKKSSLLRKLMKQAECQKPSITLTHEEWQTVNEMSSRALVRLDLLP